MQLTCNPESTMLLGARALAVTPDSSFSFMKVWVAAGLWVRTCSGTSVFSLAVQVHQSSPALVYKSRQQLIHV